MYTFQFMTVALAGLVAASPAPNSNAQQLDFTQFAAAPSVANGPSAGVLSQEVAVPTAVSVVAAVTPSASRNAIGRRDENIVLPDYNNSWFCLIYKTCTTTTKAKKPHKQTTIKKHHKKTTTRKHAMKTTSKHIVEAYTPAGYATTTRRLHAKPKTTKNPVAKPTTTKAVFHTTKNIVKPIKPTKKTVSKKQTVTKGSKPSVSLPRTILRHSTTRVTRRTTKSKVLTSPATPVVLRSSTTQKPTDNFTGIGTLSPYTSVPGRYSALQYAAPPCGYNGCGPGRNDSRVTTTTHFQNKSSTIATSDELTASISTAVNHITSKLASATTTTTTSPISSVMTPGTSPTSSSVSTSMTVDAASSSSTTTSVVITRSTSISVSTTTVDATTTSASTSVLTTQSATSTTTSRSSQTPSVIDATSSRTTSLIMLSATSSTATKSGTVSTTTTSEQNDVGSSTTSSSSPSSTSSSITSKKTTSSTSIPGSATSTVMMSSSTTTPTTTSTISTAATSSATSDAVPTSSSTSEPGRTTIASITIVTTTTHASAVATSTSSTINQTVTTTTSSESACVTTPEDGTYCGFINPEDPCAPQPDGHGPKVTPDSAEAFQSYPPFHAMATAALTSIASTGDAVYQQVFKDLDGSVSAASYLGLHTLTSYDAAKCAALCDGHKLCTSFNIYIERDPSQRPSANDSTDPTVWGYWCPRPSSITNYKCTLWGSSISTAQATNKGQWQHEFEVVVTASNGYDKTASCIPDVKPPVVAPVQSSSTTSSALTTSTTTTSTAAPTTMSTLIRTSSTSASSSTTPSPSSIASGSDKDEEQDDNKHWSEPQDCNSKAITSPTTAIGTRFIPGPFNPQICAEYAASQTKVNAAAGLGAAKGGQVQTFNAYYLNKDGQPYGTVCALFADSKGLDAAQYEGETADGVRYDVTQSWTWQLQG